MHKKAILHILLLMIALNFSSLFAQTMPGENDDKDFCQIVLNTNKKTYITGEPIFLNFLVKNITDEMIQFAAVLSPTADTEITIYRPEQFPWRYSGIFKVALYPRTLYWIDPHNTRTLRYSLIYDEKSPNSFLSEEPGKIGFVVRMAYTINDRIRRLAAFEPIEIDIVEAAGIDAGAFEILKKEQVAVDLTKGMATDETLPLFQKVAAEYHQSVYAPYCLLTISGYYLNAFLQDGSTTESQIVEPLQQIIQRYPDFPIMDLVYYQHAVFYYFTQQHDKARHWLSQLYYKFPESPKIRYADPLFKEYYFTDFDVDRGMKIPDGSWIFE